MPRKKVIPEENPEQVSDSPPPPPPPDPEPTPQKSDRQSFYDLDFNALDRGLTAEERQEWNSIYASYRGRSALNGTIIGVAPLHCGALPGASGHPRHGDVGAGTGPV